MELEPRNIPFVEAIFDAQFHESRKIKNNVIRTSNALTMHFNNR